MKQPWSKFFWSDWRSDPRLRMCGLAARGLWMEMLALMHEADPYGHLLVNGNVPTNDQLAVLAGAPPSHLPDLLGELERVGVFSRTRKGVIYSRRMLRDEKKVAIARQNGTKGGNPTLCNGGINPPLDNPPLNPGDKAQKPEARSQKPEGDKEKHEAEFAIFYERYPRKVAKPKALEAFCRKRKAGAALDDILAGLDRYVTTKPDYADWAHPATWLNGERWNDEEKDGRLQNGASPRRPSGPATGIAEGFAGAIASILGDDRGGDFPAALPLLDDKRGSEAA
jgi:hypothetical protein